MSYTTSIMSKYGDTDRVRSDIHTLNEILSRQGTQLLIDALAEQAGNTANKFKFTSGDIAMTILSLTDALAEALKERM